MLNLYVEKPGMVVQITDVEGRPQQIRRMFGLDIVVCRPLSGFRVEVANRLTVPVDVLIFLDGHVLMPSFSSIEPARTVDFGGPEYRFGDMREMERVGLPMTFKLVPGTIQVVTYGPQHQIQDAVVILCRTLDWFNRNSQMLL